jgi:hypothetical protein
MAINRAAEHKKTKPNKANLLAFSVLRKESQGLRSADSVKMRKSNLKKQSQFAVGPNWRNASNSNGLR